MKRRLLAVVLCAVLARAVVAGDPLQRSEPAAGTSTASQVKAVPGRKQLEALLLAPAHLSFGERKTVTARELLDRLHEQHQLSIRFDTPTLASMLGGQSNAAPKYSGPGPLAASSQRPSLAPIANEFGPAAATPTPPIIFSGTTIAGDGPGAYFPARVTAVVGAPITAGSGSGLPPATLALPSNELPLPSPEAPKPVPIPPQPPTTIAPDHDPLNTQEILAGLLQYGIDIQNLDLSRVSVATVLRLALDAAPTGGFEDFSGLPIPFTNAMLLDYLVEEDGLVVTTRMKALTSKETRVYSIKQLHDLPAEQLAKTIRQSIRPWSWRSQITDLGDQLKGAPLPAETLTSLIKTGIQLAGADVGISVTPSAGDAGSPDVKKTSGTDESRQMEMLGSAIVNGLVTLVQAALSGLEMVHYAEPPTGTIQTLGGKLVITQSQTAHREIAELLRQLAEE